MSDAPRAAKARTGPLLSVQDRFVLRLAVGATVGFAITLSFGWRFNFLVPMLAVQLLAAMPQPPGLRAGMVLPIVILVASVAVHSVTSLFGHSPVVLTGIIGLALLLSFYVQRRGGPGILALFVQITFCGVPLYSTFDTALGYDFAAFMLRSSVVAMITLWIAHALVPAPLPPPRPAGPPPKPAGLSRAHATRVAIADTLVLLPLLALFMAKANVSNLVILITTINLLGAIEPSGTSKMAVGLVFGNVLGGLVAVLANQLIFAADNLPHFLMTVFVVTMVFGARIAKGGPTAGIWVLSAGTFILLLGLGIAPLPGGAEESYPVRIAKIAMASAYAIGAVSLASGLRRNPAPADP